MAENKNYSDLMKLTKYDTKTSIFIDYKLIIGIEELEEVKKNGKVEHEKFTRVDTTNCPGYALVAESAVYIHTLIETYIAREQMKERKDERKP